MSINPISFRFPFDIQGKAHDDVVSAIRYCFSGLVDINQAIPQLKQQIDAKMETSQSASSGSPSHSGGGGGGGSTISGLGAVNDQLGVTSYQTQQSDNGAKIIVGDSSAVAVALDNTVTIPWFTIIDNDSSSIASLSPTAGSSLFGADEIHPGGFGIVYFDGTNFWCGATGNDSGSGMANPMEDVGDLIVGGTAGAPTRLAAGTAGDVLTSGGPGVAPSYQPSGGGGSGRGLFSSIMSAVPTIASVGLTTAWNQTGTFSAVDLADGILISDVAQGTIWEGILKTYPTPPFTVVGMFTIPIDQGSFTNVLMSVVDTLTGKFMMLRREGGANGNLSVWGATAPGSGGSYTQLFSKGSLFTSFFIFIKYVDNGTTISISFSYDGQYWPASFTYSVAKASSYLGSSGFNYIGIGISPASAPTATQLMSWTLTSP